MRLTCDCEPHSLPNTKVSIAKDHGKNYIKVRPLLVRHLLRNRLQSNLVYDCLILSWVEFMTNSLCQKLPPRVTKQNLTEAITVMIVFVNACIFITCGLKCLFISVSKSTSAQAKSCVRWLFYLTYIYQLTAVTFYSINQIFTQSTYVFSDVGAISQGFHPLLTVNFSCMMFYKTGKTH